MNVLITGGTGDIGRSTVELLISAGHSVRVVGRRPHEQVAATLGAGAEYRQCDVLDFANLSDAMKGCDAVVHLAAIRSPVGHSGRAVFESNALGTFTVFEAAEQNDVGRVVAASSINAVGNLFGISGVHVEYLPIDEDHPARTTDSYSLSKQVIEEIGRYFWRRCGISGVSLRIPAVLQHGRVLRESETTAEQRGETVFELLGLSERERMARVKDLTERFDAARRVLPADHHDEGGWFAALGHDAGMTEGEVRFLVQRSDFFTYIDELDCAHAIAQGVTEDYEGSHPLFVNSFRNRYRLPVNELARLYWPPIQEVRPQRDGEDTLVSIRRARELIRFAPRWAM